MAWKLRNQNAGAVYPVMNRGDPGEAVFADNLDRPRLLEPLTEACQKTGWQVRAYWFMPNQFHLVVGTPQPNLGAGRKWRQGEDWGGEYQRVGRGWCLGGEQSRQELLEPADTRPGPSPFGEAVQGADPAQANRIAVEGLKRMGWSAAGLKARRKGEPGKIELARELRSKTTGPLAWIAERLKQRRASRLAAPLTNASCKYDNLTN